MGKSTRMCQSCGMPMKKDPQGGGTNVDETRNQEYCSYCYHNGMFTFNGTVQEFQDFCSRKMIEKGHPKFMAWLLTRGMKRLKRWNNK